MDLKVIFFFTVFKFSNFITGSAIEKLYKKDNTFFINHFFGGDMTQCIIYKLSSLEFNPICIIYGATIM